MSNISFSGLGSGLDIGGLVTALVDAERTPKTNRLDFKEAQLQARLSAFGTVKGSLSSLQSTVNQLKSSSSFQSVDANSDDTDIFTAVASSNASAGKYQIKVDTLAQAHSLSSSGFIDAKSVIGTGTLTFSFGTLNGGSFTTNADKPTKGVVIDSSNNSLEGIRDAVNAANIGVTAAVINTGSADGIPYKLVFTSDDTGAANSLKVTVAEEGGSPTNTDTSGLSQIAYDPEAGVGSGQNLSEINTAQDADIAINGLQVFRASNTITDVIEGITLDLKKVSAGQGIALNVSTNEALAKNNVNAFIAEYNSLLEIVNQVSNYDAESEQSGILIGDSAIRSIVSRLRNEITNEVKSIVGDYKSLASIGIQTERDGSLTLDSDKYKNALDKGINVIEKLFSVSGTINDNDISYVSSRSDTQPGSYAVNISQLATQGTVTGATFSYSGSIVIDGNNDTFSVQIDGVQSATITLTQGSYTGAELALQMQSLINSDDTLKDKGSSAFVKFNTDNTFSISSDTYGSASKISIGAVGSNTLSTLGLSVGAGVIGVDVGGTINGQPAIGSGQFLTAGGVANGLKLEITGGTLGDRGFLDFSRGVADSLSSVITDILGSSSSLKAKIDGLENGIDNITDQREQLNRRVAAIEERIRSQFVALDGLLNRLNSTGSFLQSQLDSLPTIGSKK